MEIIRVQFRDACLIGSTGAVVGQEGVVAIVTGQCGGMQGVIVTMRDQTRFVPESNVKDIVVQPDDPVKTSASDAATARKR